MDIRSEAANDESLGMWEELVVLSRCLRGVTSGELSEDVNQITVPGLCSPRTRIRHLAMCCKLTASAQHHVIVMGLCLCDFVLTSSRGTSTGQGGTNKRLRASP